MKSLSDRWEVQGQIGERKPRIVNTCSCGAEYTLSGFRELRYVGRQKTEDFDPHYLELRNCPCGSTRSIGLTWDGEVSNE